MNITKFFNKSEIDLTTGDTKTLIKKFILFTLPILLVGILELLYNSFDLIVVQQHDGTIYGAAVGSNGSLIALITNAFVGLSTGLNVVIARYYGKKDAISASKALHSGMILALGSGIFLAILGFFCSRYFLVWMNVNPQYLDIATSYLSIYFLSMPFMLIYNFGASAFRGIGDSTKPLLFLFISGLLNIALNYLFVYAFQLKEVGVAISTVICQGVSAFLVILFLYLNKGFINFRFSKLKLNKKETIQIIKIGLPGGLEGVIFSISNVLLQSSVNAWPPEVVTANTNAANIESYTYTSMFAIASATPSFISANFGCGNKQNINKIHIIALVSVTIVGIVLGYLSLACADYLLKIYMGNNYNLEIIKYAKERMIVILLTYFLCGLMDTETGILRGLGYSFIPMCFTLLGCCIFRIIWDNFVYSPIETSNMHSLGILYLCYPISWIMSFSCEICTFLILRKRIYKKCEENKINFEKRLKNNLTN